MSRQPKVYLCPLCLNPATRDGFGSYFDCDECGARLVLKKGELQKTRTYNAREAGEEEGRVKSYLTASQYEELVG